MIRVTLMCLLDCETSNRELRKALIRKRFKHIVAIVEAHGGTVDMDSLSVVGQTVEARLPIKGFVELSNLLRAEQIRVDVIVTRQIL